MPLIKKERPVGEPTPCPLLHRWASTATFLNSPSSLKITLLTGASVPRLPRFD
jgi:hypothetical protein